MTVHVDRLAFSSARLRDELALEPFVPFDVPFRSVSNSDLHALFGERPLDQPTLPTPTPIHAPNATPGSLDFLDKPRAQGKRNVRRNLDPDYAYIPVSRTDMAAPEYSGARHDDIRRQQGRRAKVPPRGVNLNLYYGVGDQIVVVMAEAGAVFVHGRTGTLYFYHEEVEGFVIAFGEAYLGFWEVETPHRVPPATPLPLPIDFTTYPATALDRVWFLHADTAPAVPPGQATLAVAFERAPGHYPLSA